MDGNLSFLFDIGGNICYFSVRELVKLFVSFWLVKLIPYEMLVYFHSSSIFPWSGSVRHIESLKKY